MMGKLPVPLALEGIDLERCEMRGGYHDTPGDCTPAHPCRIHAICARLTLFGVERPKFWEQEEKTKCQST